MSAGSISSRWAMACAAVARAVGGRACSRASSVIRMARSPMACTWIWKPSRSRRGRSGPASAWSHRAARVAVPVQVGRKHRGGARLDDPVLEQLHRRRPHVRRRVPGAPVAQPREHRVAASRARSSAAITRTCSRPARSALANARSSRSSVLAENIVVMPNELASRSARSRPAASSAGVRRVGTSLHQLRRRLAQRAARLAGARIPLDPAVGWVGRILGDSCGSERP